MAENGTASDPTLVPYMVIVRQTGGYFGSTSRRFTFGAEQNLAQVKKLKEAGVKLGIGTDLVVDWYRFLPWPYHEEMRQFLALGYSLPEVLGIATKLNAELIDMGDKLGTLEPGKLADVLVVSGNPD